MTPPAAPPAPPPPPPPPAVNTEETTAVSDANALFREISQLGEAGVRQNLKKATKGPVNDEKVVVKPTAILSPKKKVIDLGGTPKCFLTGKKWTIEYQNGAKDDNSVSIDTDLKQTVYVYKCHDSLIKVNGKVNAIVLDNCSKTGCVFEEAMASVELVNSKDMQLQCTKNAPAVTIDGCVSVTYYMSSNFAKAQIITAKSAAVNLIRPTDDEDIVETPIPEQFCTTWNNGTWVTKCVDHSD